ncbi:MAG: hypothetical protein HY721_32965 [Planctomycetes bacterium]|nr:hypothetical protein [Planctomycetota bacterium]
MKTFRRGSRTAITRFRTTPTFPLPTTTRHGEPRCPTPTAILVLAALGARGALADCSGVTDPMGSGLPSVNMGPVVVTQAYLADGLTPSPLDVSDCTGGGGLKLFIPWSDSGANPPVAFSFVDACPEGADQVTITAGGLRGPGHVDGLRHRRRGGEHRHRPRRRPGDVPAGGAQDPQGQRPGRRALRPASLLDLRRGPARHHVR